MVGSNNLYHNPVDPSPEEIKEACLEIQEEWSVPEEIRRKYGSRAKRLMMVRTIMTLFSREERLKWELTE